MEGFSCRYIECNIKYSNLTKLILKVDVITVLQAAQHRFPLLIISVDSCIFSDVVTAAIVHSRATSETLLLHAIYATSFFE